MDAVEEGMDYEKRERQDKAERQRSCNEQKEPRMSSIIIIIIINIIIITIFNTTIIIVTTTIITVTIMEKW